MKVMALYSIKGGVGKSTASINLAYSGAKQGLRTLLIDLDPLGASSYCFRVHAKESNSGKALVKGGKAIMKQVRGTDYPNLDLLPSTMEYRSLDLLLDEKKHSHQRLQMSLESLEGVYDLVVIDCIPNLTLVSENVLRAANLIVVPVVPTPLALIAYDQLLDQLSELSVEKKAIHPFVSMLEQRKKLQMQIREQLLSRTETLHTIIPYASDIEKMAYFRDPVMVSAPRSKGATAYNDLWAELSTYLG